MWRYHAHGEGVTPLFSYFSYLFFLLRLYLILRFLCGSHTNVQSHLPEHLLFSPPDACLFTWLINEVPHVLSFGELAYGDGERGAASSVVGCWAAA